MDKGFEGLQPPPLQGEETAVLQDFAEDLATGLQQLVQALLLPSL